MAGLLMVGAGPGLGRSIALRFAREGMRAGLIARRSQTLDVVAAAVERTGVAVSRYRADAGHTDELQSAIAAAVSHGGVPEVVVYNAGLIQADAPGELSAAQQLEAWSVNVQGALTTANLTMPAMAERGSGSFLATGGMPVPQAAYLSLSLGKAGLRALTLMLAEYFGPRGIHAASVTVGGEIATGSAFDPDVIAEHFWRLHAQPRQHWETLYAFDGTPAWRRQPADGTAAGLTVWGSGRPAASG